MLEEFEPNHVTDFGGLFSRGPHEVIPTTHFKTATNIRYFNEGFETRYGTTLSVPTVTTLPVLRFFPYRIEGQADRILYLDSSGQIFDSLFPAAAIYYVAGLTDFSMAVFNDRAYISPHDGKTGLPGQYVHVYQGDGSPARPAAGSPPTGFMLLIDDSPLSGVISKGARLFGVAYETVSGFITQPGPIPYQKHTTNGGLKHQISNLPIGPAGTIARHVVATKVLPYPYDNNYQAHEIFFVPEGRVGDNTTTFVTFEFYDADLVASADYLKDEMPLIPAVLGMTAYQGSLVGWAPNTEPSSVYISKAGEPESISLLEGGIEVEIKSGGGVRSCVDFRGSLMIHKAQKSYITQNNGLEPVNWRVTKIDQGLGTEVFGVAAILDEEGNSTDRYLLATRKGLIVYDGSFENNITWKIDDIWKRINRTYFHKIQVVLDSINECIYLVAPLDGFDSPNVLLYADFSKGLSPTNIRWASWTFPYYPTTIGIDFDSNSKPVLKIGTDTGIYFLNPTSLLDRGVAIPQPTFQTAYFGSEDFSVNQYGGIRLRVVGNGSLNLKFYGLDDTIEVDPPSLVISPTPGRFLQREFNLQSQRGSLKAWTTLVNNKFSITKVSVYSKPIWTEEPA